MDHEESCEPSSHQSKISSVQKHSLSVFTPPMAEQHVTHSPGCPRGSLCFRILPSLHSCPWALRRADEIDINYESITEKASNLEPAKELSQGLLLAEVGDGDKLISSQ